MRALLLVILVLATASTTLAAPADGLRDAENSYLYGDYPRVIRKLTPLVDPDIMLPEPEQQARAYELLGLAHYFVDDQGNAKKFFQRLIRLRPDRRLDPVLVPPPVVAFFEQIKASLAQEIEATREALRKEKEAEEARRRRALATLVVSEVQVNSQLEAMLPFGIGQFQNRDKTLGYVFLASEILAIGTSAGLYLGIESMRRPDGRFGSEDLDQVEMMQYGQLTAGWLAVALVALGAAHALYHFEEQLPIDTLKAPPNPPRSPSNGFQPGQLTWHF